MVKHRIPFDVKNTKSSKVSLPLNIMTPPNPEQETHFQTHPHKALQSQRESVIVWPAGVFVLCLRIYAEGGQCLPHHQGETFFWIQRISVLSSKALPPPLTPSPPH